MDDTITVRCACGWETTGAEEDVIVATREHGERLHHMSASREQILAMASPASDTRLPPSEVPVRAAPADAGPDGDPDGEPRSR
jgi:hypothetical protein